MTFDELKDKALTLPLQPGVYIMRDKQDAVIYVGKAKKLKNRVGQYFQDHASHTPKTKLMVSKIDHLDVIVAASEFEALVLECSLIKRYQPKYNILLKDDKGYPYIRLNMKEEYPRFSVVARVVDDGALYFGPFGSRGVTNQLLEALMKALKLPTCSRQLPSSANTRPCLNYHMNLCAGWCRNTADKEDYRETIEGACRILRGEYKAVARELKENMLQAAENLEFERASMMRDRLNAIEALGQKQLVTAGVLSDTDVIGYWQNETKACFVVLHFRGGNLLDKDYEVFSVPDNKVHAASSLLKQYYLSGGIAPKRILLPFEMEDMELLPQLLKQALDRTVKLIVPQRGQNLQMVNLACKNAMEEVQRITTKDEKRTATLSLFGKMLGVETPKRIESFDISNISGTDIVGSMVVFVDGRPQKSQYKRFKIEGLSDQDDYASMAQVLERRFQRFLQNDSEFSKKPNLLLIDGGINHACVAVEVLKRLELDIPVFGMVKDNRHRTRALVTPQGQEISIDGTQTIFSLVGSIQEETHRFAITYHKKLRSKRLRYSELDNIHGIGPKRKQELLRTFKSIGAIRQAELYELEKVLPGNAAMAVFNYFRSKEGE